MNKKVVSAAFLFIVVTMIITGCSGSLRSENDKLKKAIAEVKNSNTNLEKTVKELEDKIKEYESMSGSAKETTFQNKSNIFQIYTSDTATYEKKVDGYIYIDSKVSLKGKVETLAKVLSEVYFGNLPVQVVKIEEVDNKKIAVVNLSESKENQGITNTNNLKGNTWSGLYFQGSTGGQVTSTQLIETLLQRDYQGQWIDGVRFLYNNGVCDYEHVPELKKTNYRK